jgi:tetratricopeptide (TPR) repeat protein
MRIVRMLAIGVAVALFWAGLGTPPASADSRAEQAIALCSKVGGVSPEERGELVKQAVTLAEQAVAENDKDPVAHYAVFCSLGRQLETQRVSAGTMTALRRVRQEVDRALELQPDYAEALMGKGSLLVNTPRLLGGDVKEGERLLRRALVLDPSNIDAHLQLAKALEWRGEREEARALAQKALVLAQEKRRPPAVEEARKLLAKLGG